MLVMIEAMFQNPIPVFYLLQFQPLVIRIKASAMDLRSLHQIFEVLSTKCNNWVGNMSSIVITISKSDGAANGLVC